MQAKQRELVPQQNRLPTRLPELQFATDYSAFSRGSVTPRHREGPPAWRKERPHGEPQAIIEDGYRSPVSAARYVKDMFQPAPDILCSDRGWKRQGISMTDLVPAHPWRRTRRVPGTSRDVEAISVRQDKEASEYARPPAVQTGTQPGSCCLLLQGVRRRAVGERPSPMMSSPRRACSRSGRVEFSGLQDLINSPRTDSVTDSEAMSRLPDDSSVESGRSVAESPRQSDAKVCKIRLQVEEDRVAVRALRLGPARFFGVDAAASGYKESKVARFQPAVETCAWPENCDIASYFRQSQGCQRDEGGCCWPQDSPETTVHGLAAHKTHPTHNGKTPYQTRSSKTTVFPAEHKTGIYEAPSHTAVIVCIVSEVLPAGETCSAVAFVRRLCYSVVATLSPKRITGPDDASDVVSRTTPTCCPSFAAIGRAVDE
ncbi:hypothetical protein C8T65DRAFT_692161 [Cerioporus squamosus]|nr:hypothetical protein C8T65DRAFT_692161 [Cerioporus squamosus]